MMKGIHNRGYMAFDNSEGIDSISALTDVFLSTPATNHVLLYDATAMKWKNQSTPAPASGSITEAQLSSGVQSKLNASGGAANPAGEIVYISDSRFGAVGNGTTNDQPAFQAALNYLSSVGGGSLYLSPGKTYLINGVVRLKNNVSIYGNRATIIKTQASPYSYFAASSQGRTGYGAGVQNVYVCDIRFQGDLANDTLVSGCGFALHHASNVVVERCEFNQVAGTGHSFDLNGCDNITIRDCLWYGSKPGTNGNQITEAIQYDTSLNGAVSNGDSGEVGSYDGLQTKNLTVENCQFLPISIGGVDYPCPNPIGCHLVVEDRLYANIRFIGNYVLDPIEYISPNDNENANPSGVTHFPSVDGLWVENNTFVQTKPRINRAISVFSYTYGVLAGQDYNQTGLTKGTFATPLISKNVWIRNNTFIGFKPQDNKTPQQIIWLRGNATGRIDGVVVEGNTFDDAYGTATTPGTSCITAQYCDDLRVGGNRYASVYQANYFYRCQNVTYSNNTHTDVRHYSLYSTDCHRVVYANNVHASFYAPAQFDVNCADVTATGNIWLDPQSTGTIANGLVFSGTKRFTATGNTISNTGTVQPRAMYAGFGADNGRITGNLFIGYTTGIDSTGAGTNVLMANN